MTEKIPWWKSFLPKRKSDATTKDKASASVVEPDFDPFAQKDPSKTIGGDQQPLSNKSNSLLSDETFDNSRLESMFNEQTCRRNLNVSRSGRFKEKRRVRSSLPIHDREAENVQGKEDKR